MSAVDKKNSIIIEEGFSSRQTFEIWNEDKKMDQLPSTRPAGRFHNVQDV